jgi:hypothetical protein
MRTRLGTGVAVVAVAMTSVFAAGASAQGTTGTVTVVHGLRGLLADVYLDGQIALDGFEPERATDPLQIPVGDHLVEIREADAPADSEPAVSGRLVVQPGDNLSAVAHLSEEGEPTLTVFDNNLSTVAPGNARLTVRHTAEAPAVDVELGGNPFSAGLVNPGEAGQDLPAATSQVAVSSAGEALLPPSDVTFAAGTAQYLYLIGSAPDGSVTWLSQTLPSAQAAPTAIPTGNSGLLDPAAAPVSVVVVVIAAAALMGTAVATERRWR